MKFGHFDDERREYVIDTPKTPLPWINYLGSEDFFSLISNTAGGYSFYRDARLRRITRYRYNTSSVRGAAVLFSRVRRSISQASPRGTKTSCVAAMPFFSPSKME